MKEIVGNLWDYYNVGFVVCITTNGFVKNNGEAVMGRGCAFEATQRFPDIRKQLGEHILRHGNTPVWLNIGLVTFPVKHSWWEEADLRLIQESARWLFEAAQSLPQRQFVLPRPGCGNGRLCWADVKPCLEFLPDNVLVIDFPKSGAR
jgi:hypothetical protein